MGDGDSVVQNGFGKEKNVLLFVFRIRYITSTMYSRREKYLFKLERAFYDLFNSAVKLEVVCLREWRKTR